MEASAGHAKEVQNVRRTYPIAILIATSIGFSISLLGGLTIAMILPANEISNTLGVLQTYTVLLTHYGLLDLLPIAAILIAIGAAGQVSTWIAGPVKSLAVAGRDGMLPRFLQSSNSHDMPVPLMLVQAIIATLIATAFVLHPNTNEVFLYIASTAVLLYSIMYLLLYSTAIRLRYKYPNVPRAYKVPFGNWGIWILGSIGFSISLIALIIGLRPPNQPDLLPSTYLSIIIPGVCLTLSVPLIFWKIRRASWKRGKQTKKAAPYTVERGLTKHLNPAGLFALYSFLRSLLTSGLILQARQQILRILKDLGFRIHDPQSAGPDIKPRTMDVQLSPSDKLLDKREGHKVIQALANTGIFQRKLRVFILVNRRTSSVIAAGSSILIQGPTNWPVSLSLPLLSRNACTPPHLQ